MLSPAITSRAACADPRLRDVVDQAFARQGGPAQRHMENHVCPTCPIARECLNDALDNGEHGPWGGTNERARRRIVRRSSTYNLRDVHVTGSSAPSPALEP